MIRVRPAVIDDVPVMLDMLREAAASQGFPDAVCVTEDDLREDGFGEAPRFHALIAERDNEPAGLALYFFTFSTWGSRNGLYLEDLCVRSGFRRTGIGRELLCELVRVAKDNGCGRFQWVVNRGNEPALNLYESFGARRLDEWVLMYMEKANITARPD